MGSLHQKSRRSLGLLPRCVIKVKVTVTKKKKFSFRSITLICFGLLTPYLVHATNATKITASFFLHCHLSCLIPARSILDWIVENLVFVALRRLLFHFLFVEHLEDSFCNKVRDDFSRLRGETMAPMNYETGDRKTGRLTDMTITPTVQIGVISHTAKLILVLMAQSTQHRHIHRII